LGGPCCPLPLGTPACSVGLRWLLQIPKSFSLPVRVPRGIWFGRTPIPAAAMLLGIVVVGSVSCMR
jgi:hypothetical protein